MMLSLKKRHSLETGFTLLEVLVAVTLVAVMAVGIWTLLSISLKSWSRGTGFIDANQSHRSILDLVQKQLASTFPLFSPNDPAQPNVRYPIFVGDANNLQFISLNSLQFMESPGLTFVYYEVTEDSNGKYALIERETPYLGQLPDDATMEQARATTVFENLTDCAFEYFSAGDSLNEPQWVTEWDAQSATGGVVRLPVAVALTMVSSDSQGNSIERRIVAPITPDPIDPRGGITTSTSTTRK